MRLLVLLLIASITFPVSAQEEGPEYEVLIQRSMTLENPDDAKRDEVEQRFRGIWPKLHELCECKPNEIGDVLATTWGGVREANLYLAARRDSPTMEDASKAQVEMIHNMIGDVH